VDGRFLWEILGDSDAASPDRVPTPVTLTPPPSSPCHPVPLDIAVNGLRKRAMSATSRSARAAATAIDFGPAVSLAQGPDDGRLRRRQASTVHPTRRSQSRSTATSSRCPHQRGDGADARHPRDIATANAPRPRPLIHDRPVSSRWPTSSVGPGPPVSPGRPLRDRRRQPARSRWRRAWPMG